MKHRICIHHGDQPQPHHQNDGHLFASFLTTEFTIFTSAATRWRQQTWWVLHLGHPWRWSLRRCAVATFLKEIHHDKSHRKASRSTNINQQNEYKNTPLNHGERWNSPFIVRCSSQNGDHNPKNGPFYNRTVGIDESIGKPRHIYHDVQVLPAHSIISATQQVTSLAGGCVPVVLIAPGVIKPYPDLSLWYWQMPCKGKGHDICSTLKWTLVCRFIGWFDNPSLLEPVCLFGCFIKQQTGSILRCWSGHPGGAERPSNPRTIKGHPVGKKSWPVASTARSSFSGIGVIEGSQVWSRLM